MKNKEYNVSVIQLGARLEYNLPIALKRSGILNAFYTDKLNTYSMVDELIKHLPLLSSSRKLKNKIDNRICDDLLNVHVEQMEIVTYLVGLQRYVLNRPYLSMHTMRKAFNKWLRTRRFKDSCYVLGFIRDLEEETIDYIHSCGSVFVGYQPCAPANIERRLYQRVAVDWPEYVIYNRVPWEQLKRLEEATWERADHLLAPSDWVYRGLRKEGYLGELEKVCFPYHVSDNSIETSRISNSKLRVGFLGRVFIMKGISYFVELAKLFKNTCVQFVATGSLHIPDAVIEEHRDVVQFEASIPRDEVSNWFEKCDVFVFPTLTEGSSEVILQAMSNEIPIITTKNAGSIIEDGVTGYICEYNDIDDMANKLDLLLADEKLRKRIGCNAKAAVRNLSYECFVEKLSSVIDGRHER